jgi:hypothetical protein
MTFTPKPTGAPKDPLRNDRGTLIAGWGGSPFVAPAAAER